MDLLAEADPQLTELLRQAGERYGPYSVAIAAAFLTDDPAHVAGRINAVTEGAEAGDPLTVRAAMRGDTRRPDRGPPPDHPARHEPEEGAPAARQPPEPST